MKTYLLIISILFYVSITMAQKIEKEYYPNGNIKSEGQVLDSGEKQGERKYFHENGKLKSNGKYEKGVKQGMWHQNYDKIMIKSIGNYIDGEKDGKWMWLHDNGKTKSVGIYKSGKKHGEWKEYNRYGELYLKENYIDNLLHGEFILYYENGKYKENGRYSRGIKQGEWKEYYENGQLESIGHFNIFPEGKWKYYYENGQLKSIGEYENGKRQGKWKEYYKNGKLYVTENYIDGSLHGDFILYHKNGKVKINGHYYNNEREGKWILYLDNGTIKEQGRYASNQRHGKWISNYDNGSIKSEGYYNMGQKDSYWRWFFRNGKIERKGELADGKRTGIWELYDTTGNLLQKGSYIDDSGEGTMEYPLLELLENEKNEQIDSLKNEAKNLFDLAIRTEHDLNIIKTKYNLIKERKDKIEKEFGGITTLLYVLAALLVLVLFLMFWSFVQRRKIKKAYKKLDIQHKELVATQEQLIHSERSAALSDMAIGLAHDLKTPLSTAMLGTENIESLIGELKEILNSNENEDSKLEEINELDQLFTEVGQSIHNDMTSIVGFINSFYEISSDQVKGEEKNIEMVSYINQKIMTILSPKIKKYNVSYSYSGTQSLYTIVQPANISRIIQNLINNTLQHGFSDAFTPDEGRKISMHIEDANNTLKLTYQDNGKGIEKDILPRIYDMYYTTHQKSISGMGMYIVKKLVEESLQGTINCESSPGNGVKFLIQFPINKVADPNL